MKRRIALLNVKIMQTVDKVISYCDTHEKERVILGSAIGLTGLALIIMITIWGLNESLFPFFLSAISVLLGIVLITNSFVATERILQKVGKEVFLYFGALLALFLLLSEIERFLLRTQSSYDYIIFTISATLFIGYALRVSVWLFSMIKKLVNGIITKLKSSGTELETQTKTWGEVLKNIVSIAGTLALVANYLLPFIIKLLGIE